MLKALISGWCSKNEANAIAKRYIAAQSSTGIPTSLRLRACAVYLLAPL